MIENKRKFVILADSTSIIRYIQKIYGNRLGYSYKLTKHKEKAKIWKFEKNCQKAVERIQSNLEPTKMYLTNFTLNVTEITDKKTLRNIKLKKLNKNMKNFKQFMKEIITESKHDYGCVMLYLDFPELKKIHDIIDKDDIYIDPNDDSYGIEKEPHVTLLYGLHNSVDFKDIKKTIEDYTFDSCEIFNPSLFKNEKYDVLKFDVKGTNLSDINNELKKFPYTSDYPDYHPHMTIAYLKPGTGKKYIDKIKLEKNHLKPLHVIYSMTNGSKKKISIK